MQHEPTIDNIDEGFSTSEMTEEHRRHVDLGTKLKEPELGEFKRLQADIEEKEKQLGRITYDYELSKSRIMVPLNESKIAINKLLALARDQLGVPNDWPFDIARAEFVAPTRAAPSVKKD